MSDETPPADEAPSAQIPNEPAEPQEQIDQQEPVEPQVETYEEPAIPQEQPPEEQPPEGPAPLPNVVARYGLMKQIGAFICNWKDLPKVGDKVVLRTERGVELGDVLTRVTDQDGLGNIRRERLEACLAANGPEYPFRRSGKILRAANEQDVIDHRHLDSSALEEATFCREQIRQLQLDMKPVAVEHLLGGERIIFYFTAGTRVDFRELVRRLAGQYHTRIELRQVGARDEARLVADYERCGLQCCCQRFLKHLQPVSMRMAKMQKATLDPAKISGRCGRLMCCLRYEDEGYEELRRKLPRRNTWVQTKDHIGRVVEVHILTQLVELALADERQVIVANEEILERDVAPPVRPGQPAAARQILAPEPPGPAAEAAQQGDAVPTAEADEVELPPAAPVPQGQPARQQPQQPGERRRRRRKRHSGMQGQQAPPGQAQAVQPQGQGPGQQARHGSRRRRHRGRGGGQQPPPAPPPVA
jgi:cell fate regulator YaaT (PSP1 superfamily)